MAAFYNSIKYLLKSTSPYRVSFRLYLLLLFAVILNSPLIAQSSQDSLPKIVQIEEDSVSIDTIYTDKAYLNRKAAVSYTIGIDGIKTYDPDTTLDLFHIYKPARQVDFRFLNTGNIGTATHYIFFDNYADFGFRTGHNQFDVYRFTKDNLSIYESRISYSNLKIVIGTNREQLYEATHHQEIGSQFKFDFNFRRFASTGVYPRQETGSNTAALYTHFNSKNKRYKLETILLLNNMKSLENGGVQYTGIFDEDTSFTTKDLVDVNTNSARTEDREMGALIRQSYAFGKKSYKQMDDTTQLYQFHPAFTFYHEIQYTRRKYNFFDTNPDSVFYGDFYSISDSIENRYTFRDFRNTVGFNFASVKGTDTSEVPIYRDFLMRGSATYAYLEWLNEFYYEPLSELNIFFTIRDHPNVNGRFLYGGTVQLALASYNQGDLRAGGYLGLQGKKWGQLRAIAEYSRQEAPYVAQRFFIRDFSWQNDFNKENYFVVGLNYNLPRYKLHLSGRMFTLNNLIYFDSNRRPQQSNLTQNVFTVSIEKNFRKKWFGWDNLIRLQFPTQDDALRVPLFWMRNSVYAQGYIFKGALLGKVGFDLYYNTPYEALYYFPLTGQFQLNGGNNVTYVPSLDIFISMKIKTLNIFAKMNNLLQGVGQQNGNFNFYRYPELDRSFRVGISWDFFN